MDQNDNPPQFGEKIYSAEIFENADVGTPVVTVTAKDLDKESNGEVVYSITGDQQGKVLFIYTVLIRNESTGIDFSNISPY